MKRICRVISQKFQSFCPIYSFFIGPQTFHNFEQAPRFHEISVSISSQSKRLSSVFATNIIHVKSIRNISCRQNSRKPETHLFHFISPYYVNSSHCQRLDISAWCSRNLKKQRDTYGFHVYMWGFGKTWQTLWTVFLLYREKICQDWMIINYSNTFLIGLHWVNTLFYYQ